MLQTIGLILVGGMIAHVVAAAAIGRRLTLEQAWAATRGKRWRLVGLTATLGLALTLHPRALRAQLGAGRAGGGRLAGAGWSTASSACPLFLAFLVWFWVRVYYLPVPALMLEPVGVFGAIGRGYHLTRGAFWRTFGIALLTVVIAQAAGAVLAMPDQLPLPGGAAGRPAQRGGRARASSSARRSPRW